MKKIFLSLFGILFFTESYASSIDSLYAALHQTEDLKAKVECYRAIADFHKLNSLDSSIYYLKQARALAAGLKEKADLGYILTDIGRLYSEREDYIISLDYFRRGYSIIRAEEKKVPPYLLIDIGNIYYDEGVYSIARSYYDKAEERFLEEQDTNGMLLVWKNKGLTYKGEHNCEQSAFYLEKALRLELQLPERYLEKAINYNYMHSVGLCLPTEERLNFMDSSLYYMQQAGGIQKSRRIWASLHYNAAYLYLFTDFKKSKEYYRIFDSTLAAYPQLERFFIYNRLIYAKGRARELGDYQAAIAYSEQILRDSLAPPRYLPQQYSVLSYLYAGIGNYKKAFEYCKEYAELNAKQNKDKFADKVVQMYAAMENFEQREALALKDLALQQERQLKEQERRMRNWFALGFAVVLLLLGISVLLFLRLRNSNQRLNLQKGLLEESAQSLQRVNETKDKLFSILGHDLRGPFHNILRLSTRLEKQLSERPMDSALQREAQSLMRSAQSSYLLFEDLLSWSKNQAGELRFVPEVVDLRELSGQLLQLFEGQIVEKQLRIETDWKARGLLADPQMLYTMLRNLIGNACKHSAYQGRIWLRSGINDDAVWIEVRDEAGGISEKAAAHLFSEDKWRKQRGNSGLGLVLCQQFMDFHSGSIRLDNRLGEGAAFHLHFPAAASRTADLQEAVEALFIQEKYDWNTLPAKELLKDLQTLKKITKLPIRAATQFLRLRKQLTEPLHPILLHGLDGLQKAIFTQNQNSYQQLQEQLAKRIEVLRESQRG